MSRHPVLGVSYLRVWELLTPRQQEVLTRMAIIRKADDPEDGELVYERGRGYLGSDPVSRRTVFALLRCCAISLEQDSKSGSLERYRINETGRRIVRASESEEG